MKLEVRGRKRNGKHFAAHIESNSPKGLAILTSNYYRNRTAVVIESDGRIVAEVSKSLDTGRWGCWYEGEWVSSATDE